MRALSAFSRHRPAPQCRSRATSYPLPPLTFMQVPVLSRFVDIEFLSWAGWWQATLSISSTPLLHPVLKFLEEKLTPLITLGPTKDSFLRRLVCTSSGWHTLTLPIHMEPLLQPLLCMPQADDSLPAVSIFVRAVTNDLTELFEVLGTSCVRPRERRRTAFAR